MRIQNCGHVAACRLDLLVHLEKIGTGEVLRVEPEVLIPVGGAVLVCPLDVHHQHVDRELEISEVGVALHYYLG